MLVVFPVLLVASPQRTGESSGRAGVAAPVADNQQAAVTDFPQLPYQGTPPELAQDRGALGLRLMLRRLGTTARLMQTVAHPDDEDGGMLTLEARGRGASVLLMTLNRGEGGQNKVGSNLSDVLGVLRTEELLAADEYYGVQERFSRVADFGFSKSAEETFGKWGGHDVALADMVRVIRTFRPDVLVARFSGTERDGHGHHQASSILTREAFRAAADPKRFSRADRSGAGAVAGEEAVHRQCVRLRCDDLRGCELDGEVKYRRGKRGSGRLVCAVCHAGVEASALAGVGELDG